jgi:hypothetical protein
MAPRWSGPGSLARQGECWSAQATCSLDVQLCRHGPATVLTEFLYNRLCHCGVFGWISCNNQNITNFKEKLLKKIPKIFNYQKSQKNCKILPKVIKITKSGHTVDMWYTTSHNSLRVWPLSSKIDTPKNDHKNLVKILISE